MVKLFVIKARDVASAVILRRGPSKWYHIILWDMKRDEFTHGAWVKGRIYAEKCDISPYGGLFIYFILKKHRSIKELTWTAISRVPWLHALALWPENSTYGGGGRFVTNRAISLNVEPESNIIKRPDSQPIGLSFVNVNLPYHSSSNEVPDTDWCGTDHAGKIIFTRGGKLFRREGKTDTLVADFTDLVPDPQPAPEWARKPL